MGGSEDHASAKILCCLQLGHDPVFGGDFVIVDKKKQIGSCSIQTRISRNGNVAFRSVDVGDVEPQPRGKFVHFVATRCVDVVVGNDNAQSDVSRQVLGCNTLDCVCKAGAPKRAHANFNKSEFHETISMSKLVDEHIFATSPYVTIIRLETPKPTVMLVL